MRSRLRVLSALLVCIGVVVTSASAGTEQASSTPPPVERVARELCRGKERDRLRLRRGQGVRGYGGCPPSLEQISDFVWGA